MSHSQPKSMVAVASTTKKTKKQLSNFPYQYQNNNEYGAKVNAEGLQSESGASLVEETLGKLGLETPECDHEAMQQPATPLKAPPWHAEKSAACSTPIQQLTSNGVPNLAIEVEAVFEGCFRFFKTHATGCVDIFRASGYTKRVNKMVDDMKKHPFAWKSINCINLFMHKHPEYTAHDVSNFFKLFIKSTFRNEPVIPYNCHRELIGLICRNQCASIGGKSRRAPGQLSVTDIAKKCGRIFGLLLEPARRVLLARLCTFLHEFSKHEATTKMNCASLAVCFVNLMHPPPAENHHLTKSHKKRAQSAEKCYDFTRAEEEAEKTKLCIAVIQILIEQSHLVFKTQLVCGVQVINPVPGPSS